MAKYKVELDIDLDLLRKQKETLIFAIDNRDGNEDLQGILHMLDSIQDQIAEEIGEHEVFG